MSVARPVHCWLLAAPEVFEPALAVVEHVDVVEELPASPFRLCQGGHFLRVVVLRMRLRG